MLAIGLVALALLWNRLDIQELHTRARATPAAGVVAVLALLPLVGFPVSWLHLIAGVRFGFAGGLAAVAITTLTHHTLGWTLVRVLPARVFRALDKWKGKLAGAGHRDAALLCALLPGMPYTATLYLLPILGAPISLLVRVSVPLHTSRAVVTILLGDVSANLTPARVALLAVYYALLAGACALALRRLRRRLRHAAPAAAAEPPARHL